MASARAKARGPTIGSICSSLGYEDPKILMRSLAEFRSSKIAKSDFTTSSNEQLEKVASDFIKRYGKKYWNGLKPRHPVYPNNANFISECLVDILKIQKRNRTDNNTRIKKKKETVFDKPDEDEDFEDDNDESDHTHSMRSSYDLRGTTLTAERPASANIPSNLDPNLFGHASPSSRAPTEDVFTQFGIQSSNNSNDSAGLLQGAQAQNYVAESVELERIPVRNNSPNDARTQQLSATPTLSRTDVIELCAYVPEIPTTSNVATQTDGPNDQELQDNNEKQNNDRPAPSYVSSSTQVDQEHSPNNKFICNGFDGEVIQIDRQQATTLLQAWLEVAEKFSVSARRNLRLASGDKKSIAQGLLDQIEDMYEQFKNKNKTLAAASVGDLMVLD